MLISEGMVLNKKAAQVYSPSPVRNSIKVKAEKLTNSRHLSPEIDRKARKRVTEMSVKRTSKTMNDLD